MTVNKSDILIDIPAQTLYLREGDRIIMQYPVSTALLGLGEHKNTDKTPRGLHQIRAKIGEGCPMNTVFVGRRPTGEIYSPELGAEFPNRDWILTRILWLSGMQKGFNRLGDVDTLRRYIYIHGTPDENPLGVPLSHGCVRMHGEALVDLFNRVSVGTHVLIHEKGI